MLESLLQAILAQIEQPKKDVEHNLRALLNEAIEQMDLVSKNEIDRQKNHLKLANARLDALQQQVDLLELKLQQHTKAL
ncbi:accessory factor UbiK family protein [Acinetobacter sp. MD2(2019)]|uniref:accessory factor UbiK family protein n=1 Tax=Acinetobacter sp. MD2(2019) TaxID=2605273 RepID=UPI002D1F4F58|nr:accessory factor UbiK family protein [Acinetobacter sp. MD2(2019)]MEB3753298.1 accessory factor UbiK family protein [Acinetobacter sp. MD2(2019)]